MRELLESRLTALKGEYDKGQAELQKLQGQLTSLQQTMLRISGAILILEELLASPTPLQATDQHATPEVQKSPHLSAEAA